MMIRIKRFELLLVNIIGLFILFFIIREILGPWIMFRTIHVQDTSIFNQFWLKIKAGLVLLGIYVIVANILSIAGLLLSKQKGNQELKLGFKYTLYLTSFLVILYIVLLVYVFID